MIERRRFTCPVCGYPELSSPAYADLPDRLPIPDSVAPPYERQFGAASYDVCPSCGFEFGFDDNPGAGRGESFAEYRATWLAGGPTWWASPSSPPNDWNPRAQLAALGHPWSTGEE